MVSRMYIGPLSGSKGASERTACGRRRRRRARIRWPPATRRWRCPHRSPEVIERTALELGEQLPVVGERGAAAELIPTRTYAPLEERHHSAGVVDDHLEPGQLVQELGEDEPRLGD